MDEQQKKMAEELLFSDKKKQSFAKKLYFGVYDPVSLFPFPEPKPESKAKADALVSSLKAFADKNIDGAKIDKEADIPETVIQGLGKLGIFGITVPTQYGGLGLTQYAYCKSLETLARYCASTALIVNAHQSIGLRALLLFCSEEQRLKWLSPLAKGELMAAFALTEPNAGSDASGVETKAVYDPVKNVYRLNGKKQWITNGSIAKVLTVMAQTEVETPQGKQEKITAFLVTPDMPGFKVTAKALDKVGMRGTKTALLEFKDMEVPAENMMGPKGAGLRVCLTCLDFGRTAFGATCTGAAKELLERATKHAKNRYQFKRPLASFTLVKEKIARMTALTYAIDATTYQTAGLIDSGVEDFMLEAAMLKVFASDSVWSILYDSMQILGGKSFFTDEPYERMMRDARLNMIGEGSNEVLRAFIGLVGMRDVGMQLQGALEAIKNPFSDIPLLVHFMQEYVKRLGRPKVPVKSPQLEKEAKRLGNLVRKFGFAIVRLLAHYREDIVEHQLELDRIATAAIAIYTTTAVLSKIDSALIRHQGSEDTVKKDLLSAKFYCREALEKGENCLKKLFDKSDAKIEQLSDLMTKMTK